MATNIKGNPIHQCSLEHYDRYRLRNSSGNIIAVGSRADMRRMTEGTFIKGKLVAPPLVGEYERFATATA